MTIVGQKRALTRRSVLAAAGGLAASSIETFGDADACAATRKALWQPAVGTHIRMTIEFRRSKSGKLRGREDVSYTINADRTMTMSVRSESFDPAVVRDAIYLLGADFYPRSCQVQTTVDGRVVGTAWYDFSSPVAELVGQDAKERINRTYRLPTPVRALIAHPVSTDVLAGMAADKSRPGEIINATGVYLTSADPYGRSAPSLVTADVGIAFLGLAPIQTPIGALHADHYLLYLRNGDGQLAPFQDLWCAANTPIFLQAYARAPVSTSYKVSRMEVINHHKG